MRILALILNKVRHFYYSFLNSLCFSWNGRALRGAHLPCSGVSPLGALVSPHPPPNAGSLRPAAQRGMCGLVTGRDTPANQNNWENPNPNLLSEQIIQILISFKHYLCVCVFFLTNRSRPLCQRAMRCIGGERVCLLGNARFL